MEIVLDIHAWAYLARRAFASYTPKLGSVVFENAFVVQVRPRVLIYHTKTLQWRRGGAYCKGPDPRSHEKASLPLAPRQKCL